VTPKAEPAERLNVRKTDGRPKREMSSFGHVFKRHVVSARYEGHGVQCRPKVTETCPELGEGMDIRNKETRQVLSQSLP